MTSFSFSFIMLSTLASRSEAKIARHIFDEVQKQKHFSFELDGSLVGREYNNEHDFAYAWYREEMKANGLNPDIEIEQKGNQSLSLIHI